MTISRPKQKFIFFVLFLIISIEIIETSFAWPIFGTLFTSKTSTLFPHEISLQWRNFLYGIAMGISSLFMFLSSPILGDISDRFGRGKTLLFCLFGMSFSMIVTIIGIIIKSPTLIILSRILVGIMVVSRVIAKAAIIDMSNEKNKITNIAMTAAIKNFGFIVGPLIGGLLIDSTLVSWFNLSIPFGFLGIFALLSACLLLFIYKAIPQNKSAEKISLASNFKVFHRALIHKKIRTLAIVYICFQLGWCIYFQTSFLTLIQKYNYSSKSSGYFLAWFGLVYCLNLTLVIRLIMRFINLKKTIYLASIIATICSITIIHNNENMLWLFIAVMATAISLGANAIVTTFSNIALKNEQGWIMGIANSIASLAWTIGPPLVGAILSFGSFVPLSIAGVLFLIGAIIAMVMPSENISLEQQLTKDFHHK